LRTEANGLSYRYYQRIEAGEQNLTLRTLNRLARTFSVPVDELLRFDILPARRHKE